MPPQNTDQDGNEPPPTPTPTFEDQRKAWLAVADQELERLNKEFMDSVFHSDKATKARQKWGEPMKRVDEGIEQSVSDYLHGFRQRATQPPRASEHESAVAKMRSEVMAASRYTMATIREHKDALPPVDASSQASGADMPPLTDDQRRTIRKLRVDLAAEVASRKAGNGPDMDVVHAAEALLLARGVKLPSEEEVMASELPPLTNEQRLVTRQLRSEVEAEVASRKAGKEANRDALKSTEAFVRAFGIEEDVEEELQRLGLSESANGEGTVSSGGEGMSSKLQSLLSWLLSRR